MSKDKLFIKTLLMATHAKIKKGTEWGDNGYAEVLCVIKEIDSLHKQMSLIHPEFGGFAWVSIDDCDLMTKKNFKAILCDNCGGYLVEKEGDYCKCCNEEDEPTEEFETDEIV